MQTAQRIGHLRESVIREMTRIALESGAINLSQGYPDFDAPEEIKAAAIEAIQSGDNQYTVTWGYPALRQQLAKSYSKRLGWQVDPDVHVTVTCGVTEGIVAAQMAILDPGDEILIIEPAHENFRPGCYFAGATPVAVPLKAPDYRLDRDQLAAAITPRTKAILLNTPHNPTGRVFDQAEIDGLIEIILKHNLILITDEIYDRILYDGRQHISPGSLEPLRDRTITVSGLSKTFSITGWRLGYVIAPTRFAAAVRPIHDYLTICAPTPLQAAAATALNLPQSYYDQMVMDYHQRRDLMMSILKEIGFVAPVPEGAYYILADYSQIPIPQAAWDATRFAMWMTKEIGVAVVPGTNFYTMPEYGEHKVRFAFPKRLATLQTAGERMMKMCR